MRRRLAVAMACLVLGAVYIRLRTVNGERPSSVAHERQANADVAHQVHATTTLRPTVSAVAVTHATQIAPPRDEYKPVANFSFISNCVHVPLVAGWSTSTPTDLPLRSIGQVCCPPKDLAGSGTMACFQHLVRPR